MITQEEHRDALAQALANARIAGHEPAPRFLADVAAVVEGAMTHGQAIRGCADRAHGRNESDLRGFSKT
ncbi:antitoxin VbhA family protein [Variovorax gossypii]